MRVVNASEITKTVRQLCIDANVNLPEDVCRAIDMAIQREDYLPARNTLELLVENYGIAAKNQVAICQDTGLACVFVEIGQEVYVDGSIEDAINEGVRQGYRDGYLRKSCVADPLRRTNTGDNTPAMIYYEIVKGDGLKITVAPKGFGSENMSAIKMLVPADGVEGVKKFVLDTVANAGPNPCPPIVVGIGIGGTDLHVGEGQAHGGGAAGQRPCWQKKHCSGMYHGQMKILFTGGWKMNCWKR